MFQDFWESVLFRSNSNQQLKKNYFVVRLATEIPDFINCQSVLENLIKTLAEPK